MKRFLFIGELKANVGPTHVNKVFIEHCDHSMNFVKLGHVRYIRRLESVFKCLFFKNIVFSSIPPSLEFRIAKVFKKRIFYLMHGCVEYENAINQMYYNQELLDSEIEMFESSYKIIAVSETYAGWVKDRYPQYSNKVTYINNALSLNSTFVERKKLSKSEKTIAVTGGNRFQKCNIDICKAVEYLNSKGYNIHIKVFGEFFKNGDSLMDYSFVSKMGQMEKEQYYKELLDTDLMVLNSEVESFGLVVGDALNCGCSLLMSKNVGAICVFEDLRDTDIIQDNHNIDEISNKICFLLCNSNANRLFNSLDHQKCSGKNAYLRLKSICLG